MYIYIYIYTHMYIYIHTYICICYICIYTQLRCLLVLRQVDQHLGTARRGDETNGTALTAIS